MKSFVVAVIIFAAVCLTVGGMTVYDVRTVHYFAEETQKITDSITEELTEDDVRQVEELAEKWKKVSGMLTLSVSHEDLTNIEDHLAAARGAARIYDASELSVSLSRLSNAIWHLYDLVRFHPDNII